MGTGREGLWAPYLLEFHDSTNWMPTGFVGALNASRIQGDGSEEQSTIVLDDRGLVLGDTFDVDEYLRDFDAGFEDPINTVDETFPLSGFEGNSDTVDTERDLSWLNFLMAFEPRELGINRNVQGSAVVGPPVLSFTV